MDGEPKPLDRTIEISSTEGVKRALAERSNWIARLGEEAINRSNPRLRAFVLERRAVIDQIESDLESVLRDKDRLFISYSGSDNAFFTCAKRIAESKYGFEVVTGPFVRDEENQLHLSIRKTIAAANAFLGIWTEEYEATSSRDGTTGGVPSAWLPFELGVAMAHDLPFRLCIHRGVHRDFREKIESNRIHHQFDASDYEGVFDTYIGDLRARIVEQRFRRLGEVSGWPPRPGDSMGASEEDRL